MSESRDIASLRKSAPLGAPVGITDCCGADTFNVLRLLGSDNILRSEQGLYLYLVVADCVLTRDLDVPAAAGLSTLIR